jgi:redox-sensitive bicupin YhaK (pirin superfamily)
MNATTPASTATATATVTLQRLDTRRERIGHGLQVQGIRGAAAVLDPFIAVDHFHMTQPTFPPHPHAGFSAVTYLFDDAETGFLNRDSLGYEGPILPGEMHWTLAGAGVMHEEFPLQPGRVAHGLQIFVNLPAALKQMPPQALHLAREAMPRLAGDGWRATVVFGALLGDAAPLALPLRAALAIVEIEAGAAFEHRLPADEAGFAIVVAGQGRAGAEPLREGEAFVWPAAGLRIEAGAPLRLALFSGRPLAEPVVQHGPFVMNTEAQIADAMRRFQQGAMGRLASAAPTVR